MKKDKLVCYHTFRGTIHWIKLLQVYVARQTRNTDIEMANQLNFDNSAELYNEVHELVSSEYLRISYRRTNNNQDQI